MEKINIIDLNFLEEKQTIAAFLVESEGGPVLVETGPESTWPQLESGINRLGYQISDIKHVLLSHIHFDHAGAAWKMAAAGARVYVHPLGLPHLASPERLWQSAAKIYGDDMDRLWGEMRPIPTNRLQEVRQGEKLELGGLEFKALHTPGHAIHHIAWQLGEVLFTGDVAGVKINKGPVVPPCPPPDIHIEAWKESIALLKKSAPKQLYLTHYGVVENPENHLVALEEIIMDWANWMKPYYDQNADPQKITPKFMEYTRNMLVESGVSEPDIHKYESANPSWMSVAGLMRYWKLKEQGRI